jgi:hypothetical protein
MLVPQNVHGKSTGAVCYLIDADTPLRLRPF